jgi:hypothetical protein
MAKRHDISAEYARQLLDYNPETGVLTWKARTPDMFKDGKRPKEWRCRNWNSKCAGKVAGCDRGDGYWVLRIDDILHFRHRIAWLIKTGDWPSDEIDHRDGVDKGDVISNLRPATHAENMQNARMKRNNKSGFIGVSWSKAASKWGARINFQGRYVHLGLFDDPAEASAAYLKAKIEFHPFQPVPRA